MLSYCQLDVKTNTDELRKNDICLLRTEQIVPLWAGWGVAHQIGTPVKVINICESQVLVSDADENKFIVKKQDLFLLPSKFRKDIKIFSLPLLFLKWINKDQIFRYFFIFYSDNSFELKFIEIKIKMERGNNND